MNAPPAMDACHSNSGMHLGAAVLVAALALTACANHPPLEVAKVELQSFEGGYFEIAKLPRATQKDCFGTMAFYKKVSENELSVLNECHEGALDGPLRRVAARAVVTDPEEPAKLAVDFGGFFGDYWIVEVADDYRYAAVGHPSRDYLWILSRTAQMREGEFDALTARMQDMGFPVANLELTVQRADGDAVAPSAPVEEVPKLARHGCSVHGPMDTSWGALAAGLGALLLLGRRRVIGRGR